MPNIIVCLPNSIWLEVLDFLGAFFVVVGAYIGTADPKCFCLCAHSGSQQTFAGEQLSARQPPVAKKMACSLSVFVHGEGQRVSAGLSSFSYRGTNPIAGPPLLASSQLNYFLKFLHPVVPSLGTLGLQPKISVGTQIFSPSYWPMWDQWQVFRHHLRTIQQGKVCMDILFCTWVILTGQGFKVRISNRVEKACRGFVLSIAV